MASLSCKGAVILMVLVAILVSEANAACSFQAIFSFGDSNSDVGGFAAAFPSQQSPYGMTYFNRPTGRQSDDSVFVDFIAQGLGLSFISPYLQSIGLDFRQGASFATSASTILQPTSSLFTTGVSPFYLAVQINQMRQFQSRVPELQAHQAAQSNLPQPGVFGQSLYIIYIGQNDFTGLASSAGPGGVSQISPQMVQETVNAVRQLYSLGVRTFFVLNIGPVGCYPTFLVQFPHEASDLDAAGCMTSYNNAVSDYNSQLRSGIQQVRQELSDANIVYVDVYSVLLQLYQNPTSQGFQNGSTACCGYGGGAYNYNQQVSCGATKQIDGNTVTAAACGDPQNYVSWDGVHLTEAANRVLASSILSGSIFDPAFPLNQYCDIQPIG